MRQHAPQSGFTLLELLLYIGIASAILLSSSLFLFVLLESRVKHQTIAEVEQQGAQVMHVITQAVRNAESVDGLDPGENDNELELAMANPALDPTLFDLNNGTFRVQEGNESTVTLTNARVTVSDLTFQNLSRDETAGIIRIQFTVSHKNPSGRNEYQFQKTFIGSATLRKP